MLLTEHWPLWGNLGRFLRKKRGSPLGGGLPQGIKDDDFGLVTVIIQQCACLDQENAV